MRAARAHGRTRIVLGGGVACNGALQQALARAANADGRDVYAPTPRLATDNAAMIAAAGAFHGERGLDVDPHFSAHSARVIPGMFRSPSTPSVP